ncbi:MAG TPA: hypothetical protein VM677_08805 [Actinokineospora sp.]|jgi:hypothetical protein|nr:hypothetical protein [Actinokineospora sp.]
MTAPRLVPARLAIGLLVALFAVAALVADGIGGMLIALALIALVVATYAAIAGQADWAFVPNRRRAGALAAIAVAALLTGGALLPARAPSTLTAAPAAKPSMGTSTTDPTTTSAETPSTTVATTTLVATSTTAASATLKTTTTRTKPTTTTPAAAPQPVAAVPTKPGCDPSYPTLCLPLTGPDLDCKQITQRKFPVRQPDRHGFDRNLDGIGCES